MRTPTLYLDCSQTYRDGSRAIDAGRVLVDMDGPTITVLETEFRSDATPEDIVHMVTGAHDKHGCRFVILDAPAHVREMVAQFLKHRGIDVGLYTVRPI